MNSKRTIVQANLNLNSKRDVYSRKKQEDTCLERLGVQHKMTRHARWTSQVQSSEAKASTFVARTQSSRVRRRQSLNSVLEILRHGSRHEARDPCGNAVTG